MFKKMEKLHKHGFSYQYLAGVFAHKGMKGLTSIEHELKKLKKKK